MLTVVSSYPLSLAGIIRSGAISVPARLWKIVFLREDRPDLVHFKKHLEISPVPCRLLRLLKTHWTKVLFAVVGTGSKIILDYVIRRLDALSAGLKLVGRLNLR